MSAIVVASALLPMASMSCAADIPRVLEFLIPMFLDIPEDQKGVEFLERARSAHQVDACGPPEPKPHQMPNTGGLHH